MTYWENWQGCLEYSLNITEVSCEDGFNIYSYDLSNKIQICPSSDTVEQSIRYGLRRSCMIKTKIEVCKIEWFNAIKV